MQKEIKDNLRIESQAGWEKFCNDISLETNHTGSWHIIENFLKPKGQRDYPALRLNAKTAKSNADKAQLFTESVERHFGIQSDNFDSKHFDEVNQFIGDNYVYFYPPEDPNDYRVEQNLFRLPSDMNLKIKTGTVGYNNKILISDGNFILGKYEKVNSLETPAIKNHKTNSLETPTIKNHKTNPLETPTMKSTQTVVNSERTADLEQKTIISHEDEKVALVLSLTGIFMICLVHFSMKVSHQLSKKVFTRRHFCMGHRLRYINHMSV